MENACSISFANRATESIALPQILAFVSSAIKTWCKQKGWEFILNKKSTSWRGLDATEQNMITNEKAAIVLMAASTSIIKRPVIENEKGEVVVVGFDANVYKSTFH